MLHFITARKQVFRRWVIQVSQAFLGGEGLNVRQPCHFTIQCVQISIKGYNPLHIFKMSVFRVQDVHVKVNTLKFAIRDSKHDFLYKTLRVSDHLPLVLSRDRSKRLLGMCWSLGLSTLMASSLLFVIIWKVLRPQRLSRMSVLFYS